MKVDRIGLLAVVCLAALGALLPPTGATWSPSPTGYDASWMGSMGSVISDKVLGDLMIPGTHDSGAYQLYDRMAPGNSQLLDDIVDIADKFGIDAFELIRRWGTAQGFPLYQQLTGGMRFIDLRACYNGSTWITDHMIQGNPILSVLATDIARFLKEQPTEILIVSVSHLYGSDNATQAALLDALETLWGPHFVPSTVDLTTTTVGQLVAAGTTLVATFENPAMIGNRVQWWDPDNLVVGTYTNQDRVTDMEADNYDRFSTLGSASILLETSWTLTTRARDVIEGEVDPAATRSLEELARHANTELWTWSAFFSTYYNLGNVFMVDWSQQTPVVSLAQKVARRNCTDDPAYRGYPGGCRAWAADDGWCTLNATTSAFMASHCRLSCGLCPDPPGTPGDACGSASDCYSGVCGPTQVCLVHDPRPAGAPCGFDPHCASAVCFPTNSTCAAAAAL